MSNPCNSSSTSSLMAQKLIVWFWSQFDGSKTKSFLNVFEDCSKETYEAMMKSLIEVDLTKVVEETDNTDLSGELACAGGACEVKFMWKSSWHLTIIIVLS